MNTTAALATNKFGRILLHTACLLHHPAHAGWHWRGILREFSISTNTLPRITRMLIIAAVLLVSALTAASHQVFEVWPYFQSEAATPPSDGNHGE